MPTTISYTVDNLTFEWDEDKAAAVRKKHRVSFEEAASAFLDVNGLLISDPDHSEWEERFVLLGFSSQANLLVVSHCLRYSETVIRLISARRATKKEAMTYHERWLR